MPAATQEVSAEPAEETGGKKVESDSLPLPPAEGEDIPKRQKRRVTLATATVSLTWAAWRPLVVDGWARVARSACALARSHRDAVHAHIPERERVRRAAFFFLASCTRGVTDAMHCFTSRCLADPMRQ